MTNKDVKRIASYTGAEVSRFVHEVQDTDMLQQTVSPLADDAKNALQDAALQPLEITGDDRPYHHFEAVPVRKRRSSFFTSSIVAYSKDREPLALPISVRNRYQHHEAAIAVCDLLNRLFRGMTKEMVEDRLHIHS